MKILFKSLTLASLVIGLFACAEPVVFGVPESVWNCLTTLQQQEVIEEYNQEKINDPNKCCLVGDAQKNIYQCDKSCFRTLSYSQYVSRSLEKADP